MWKYCPLQKMGESQLKQEKIKAWTLHICNVMCVCVCVCVCVCECVCLKKKNLLFNFLFTFLSWTIDEQNKQQDSLNVQVQAPHRNYSTSYFNQFVVVYRKWVLQV